MPLEALLMLASAGVSAGGAILGGIGAYQSGKLNAFNIETESILAKAQGVQQANIRNEQFKIAMQSAAAAFSAAGRDIDPSMEAFYRAEESVFGKDMSDLEMMTRLNQLKLRQQGAAEMRAGREAFAASLLRATSTGLSAYSDYMDVK